MTKDAVEQVWKSYLEAYGNVSAEERQRLLRQSVSEDIVSANPGEEFDGFEGLDAHIQQFQQRLPGAYFTLNKLLFHHGQVLAEWTLFNSDGSALRTAHTYGRFDDRERLSHLTGFF
jgi:hypothetical protein